MIKIIFAIILVLGCGIGLANYIACFMFNYEESTKDFPRLFKNKILIFITGLCLLISIICTINHLIKEKEDPSKYELITEPLYRLKNNVQKF